MLLNGSALNLAWLNGATGDLKSLASLAGCSAIAQASVAAAKACQSQSVAAGFVVGFASIQKTIDVHARASEYVSAWLALSFQLAGDSMAQVQVAGVLQKIATVATGTGAQVQVQVSARASVDFSLQGQALVTAQGFASVTREAKLASSAVAQANTTGDASVAFMVSGHLIAQATCVGSEAKTISLSGGAMGFVQTQTVPALQVLLQGIGGVRPNGSGALDVGQSLKATASGLAVGVASVFKSNVLEARGTTTALMQGQLGARLFIASQLDATVQAQAPLTKLCTVVAGAEVRVQVVAAGGVLHQCESKTFAALTRAQAAGYALASLDVPLQALTAQAIASVQGLASLAKRCDAACLAVSQLNGEGLITKSIDAFGSAQGHVSAEVVLSKQCEAQGHGSVESFAASSLTKPIAIITAIGKAQTLGDAYLFKHLSVSAQGLIATQTQLDLGRPLQSITAKGAVQSLGLASMTKLIGAMAAGGTAQVFAQAQLTKPIGVASQADSSVIALAAINKPLALRAASSTSLNGEATLEKILAIDAQAKAASSAQARVDKSLALLVDAQAITQVQAIDITKRLTLQVQAVATTASDALLLKTIDARAQGIVSLSAQANCIKVSQAQGTCVTLSGASVDLRIPLAGSLRFENLGLGTCSLTKRLDGAGDAPIQVSPKLSHAV
ncbi:MAG: hypothetical protein EB072_14605, partial [Betaproteobacteria bacterium]|nr:hypothetical protein [Betaproteobacteria bacterium]